MHTHTSIRTVESLTQALVFHVFLAILCLRGGALEGFATGLRFQAENRRRGGSEAGRNASKLFLSVTDAGQE
jgi:hypothetical protein